MPTNQLSDKRIQSLKLPGNYPDGGNLYVRVRQSGSKSFIVKATVAKRQREWTIGLYGAAAHQFSLAKARKVRDEIMAQVRAGQPPATNKPAKPVSQGDLSRLLSLVFRHFQNFDKQSGCVGDAV